MLTPKQENFCLAYLETGNASEAYRRAYNAEKMGGATIRAKANELLRNGNITVRLAELRAPVVTKAQITLEDHLSTLAMLRDAAFNAEKYGPAIQAEVARGKAAGLQVDKHELTGKGGKDLIPPTGIVVEFVIPVK